MLLNKLYHPLYLIFDQFLVIWMLGAVYLITSCSLTTRQGKDGLHLLKEPSGYLSLKTATLPCGPVGQGTIDSSLQHKIAHTRLWAFYLKDQANTGGYKMNLHVGTRLVNFTM